MFVVNIPHCDCKQLLQTKETHNFSLSYFKRSAFWKSASRENVDHDLKIRLEGNMVKNAPKAENRFLVNFK